MNTEDTYTPQMRAAVLAKIDHDCRRAGLTTYTTLRETLRVVQENANITTQQIYGMAIGAGVRGDVLKPMEDWNKDHAEVMQRVKDATP